MPGNAQTTNVETVSRANSYPAFESTRQQILQRLSDDRTLLVIYNAESSEQIDAFKSTLNQSRWARWNNQLIFKKPDEVTEQDLTQYALLITGTASANLHLKRIARKIPLELHDSHFTFLNKEYKDPRDVITLLYPNPYNTSQPLYIITGNNEADIIPMLRERLRTLDYQIKRGDQRLRIGNFSQEASTLWQPDPGLDNDFEDDLVLISSTEHFRFYAHGATPDQNLLSEIIMEREKVYDRVASSPWASASIDKPLTYILYPSLERKAVVTNSMEFAHVDARQQTIHVALEDGIRGDLVNKEALLLARTMIGTTPHRVFEDGLGLLSGNTWFNEALYCLDGTHCLRWPEPPGTYSS